MIYINAVFALFSLLWLISEIAGAEAGSGPWFALAFALLCAANTVNLLEGNNRPRQRVQTLGEPLKFGGEPVAGRPDVPAAYGLLAADAGQGLMIWSDVRQRLVEPENYWLCTTRTNGQPHSAPVWGVWLNDAFYFGTHRDSVKARNLAANPYLSLHLDSSRQVVIVEGPVTEICDLRVRTMVDEAMAGKYDLESSETEEDHNPLFCMQPNVAFAWSSKDFAASATRWLFSM